MQVHETNAQAYTHEIPWTETKKLIANPLISISKQIVWVRKS